MIGDSGIVLLGSTSGMDATQATFPFKTLIANNFIHEVGNAKGITLDSN